MAWKPKNLSVVLAGDASHTATSACCADTSTIWKVSRPERVSSLTKRAWIEKPSAESAMSPSGTHPDMSEALQYPNADMSTASHSWREGSATASGYGLLLVVDRRFCLLFFMLQRLKSVSTQLGAVRHGTMTASHCHPTYSGNSTIC